MSGSSSACRSLLGFAATLVLCAVFAGCKPKDINSQYGLRKGPAGGDSVNGTAVLGGMFESAGFKVQTWRRLSPRLEKSKVIVWAPDSFQPPTLEQRTWLENWLTSQSGRTLVYIGRDYEAGIHYWKSVLPTAPADQKVEISRRIANLQSQHDAGRMSMPKDEYARWFQVRRDGAKTSVRALSGKWADGIDASRIEIEIEGRLALPTEKDLDTHLNPPTPKKTANTSTTPPPGKTSPFQFTKDEDWEEPKFLLDYEPLLLAGKDPIVTRVTDSSWNGSQILVVTNGSFLLNLPLVNHEHRKLASKLIDECGTSNKDIATFVESGRFGLQVMKNDPEDSRPTGLELFTVWPINVIVIHLIALGILFCFARFPIFGRPATLPNDAVSDFQNHINAVGELLEKSKNEPFARERLAHFQQTVKRDPPAGAIRGKTSSS